MSNSTKNLERGYLVHTGRELELMLAGSKPLAHFCDAYPPEPSEDIIPAAAFAPYVADGRFLTRMYVELLCHAPPAGHEHVRGTLHVFYARPSEEWRIDAYIQLQVSSANAGWSEAFERRQGTLLGYEAWQCDLHMEALRANPVSRDWYWLRAK
jgi:hypothetical protein